MAYQQNANNPPNPINASAGKTVTSSFLLNLSETLNSATAHNSLHVMSAAFPGGACTVTAATVSNVLVYRLPIVSNNHRTLRVAFRTKRVGSNGTITFRMVDSNGVTLDTASTAVDSASVTVSHDTKFLTASSFPSKSTFVDLEVDLQAPSLSDAIIETIAANWSPITVSGTVSTPVGNIISVGTNAVATKDPLSAALGEAYIESIRTLQQRPRSIVSVSGVDGVSNTDQAFVCPTVRPHIFRVTPSDNMTVAGYVRVKNDSSSAQDVVVGIGPASSVFSSPASSTNAFTPTSIKTVSVNAGFDGFINFSNIGVFPEDSDQLSNVPDGDFSFIAVGCLSMVPRAPFGLDDINRTPDIKIRGYSFWSSY